MNRLIAGACILTVALISTAYKRKDSAPIPGPVAAARFIAIVPLNASGNIDWFDTRSSLPEDQAAWGRVEDALRKWGHYTITIDPHQADVLLAIRTGRVAAATGGVIVGSPGVSVGVPNQRRGPTVGGTSGAEVGPAEDTMAVFLGTSTEDTPLWIRKQQNGLEGSLPLLKQFENDVETTSKLLAKH